MSLGSALIAHGTLPEDTRRQEMRRGTIDGTLFLESIYECGDVECGKFTAGRGIRRRDIWREIAPIHTCRRFLGTAGARCFEDVAAKVEGSILN